MKEKKWFILIGAALVVIMPAFSFGQDSIKANLAVYMRAAAEMGF